MSSGYHFTIITTNQSSWISNFPPNPYKSMNQIAKKAYTYQHSKSSHSDCIACIYCDTFVSLCSELNIYVDKLSLVPFDWCHRNSFVFYIHCNCNRNHLAYRIFSFFSYAVFWFISESILRLNCIPAAATIILLFLMFILLLSAYRIYAHHVSIEMWVHLA